MKNSWLSSVALSALAAGASTIIGGLPPAQAADLPTYPTKAPAIAQPLFTWGGFYLGAHAGYVWGKEDDDQSLSFPATTATPTGSTTTTESTTTESTTIATSTPAADKFDVDGFVAGVHGGYNWQVDRFVFGVEGDIDYADVNGSHDFGYWGGNYAGRLSLDSDWQASLRLRAGYAFDRLLVYATGGIAFGHAELRAHGYDYDNLVRFDNSDSNVHTGWTAGGGIEFAFTDNWIGRIEARYTDFGSKTYDLGDSGKIRSSWEQTTITAGISYKF
jgi:outer membrane immunogenic protein